MNVLLFNTYPQGGAGIACRRLQSALQASGLNAGLLSASDTGSRWPFYAERLSFLPYERDKSVRFAFSPANFGKNLRFHPLVQQADILHLHWINQGFLSLQGIHDLASLGKPIVWTLHDMWAFTGGCHYSRGCQRFELHCGQCPYLRRPAEDDLSNRIWQRKKQLFPADIQFVTCSEWLRDVALTSGLLRDYPVKAIPNPIDTDVFHPVHKTERQAFKQEHGIAPDARVLLFVAMKVNETRKGFKYLMEALQTLRVGAPELPLEIVVLGQADPEVLAALPYPVKALGLIRGEAQLARVYACSDVFVIPSLEDNLPNTVMESLACGTPVAGFATGGIPEMVGHEQEGFIAPQGDASRLADGIRWILEDKQKLVLLRQNARAKVEQRYTRAVVAGRYRALYEELRN